MKLTRCDNCGAESPGSIGWLQVERYGGIQLGTFGESDGPWHFCSFTCIGQWAAGMIDRVA